jgi:hypothetical protein
VMLSRMACSLLFGFFIVRSFRFFLSLVSPTPVAPNDTGPHNTMCSRWMRIWQSSASHYVLLKLQIG